MIQTSSTRKGYSCYGSVWVSYTHVSNPSFMFMLIIPINSLVFQGSLA